MKKYNNLRLLLAFVSTCCLVPILSAQTLIWGYNAPVGQAAGEFRNTFVQATIAGNYAPTQWTALSISDSSGLRTPGAAFWTRTTLGGSQGFYASGVYSFAATTASNGAAIFDSDFLDNDSLGLSAMGTGTSAGTQRGALISPRIDLSAAVDSVLIVSFHSEYRYFDLTELSVALSKDDGVTWEPPVDIAALQPVGQNDWVQGRLRILMDSFTTGGVSLNQCRLRFIFEGNYYFALIDDLSIEIAPTYDLAIGRADQTASSLEGMGNIIRMGGNVHQVYENIDFNNRVGWSWGAKVANYGGEAVVPSQRPRLYCRVSGVDLITGASFPTIYMDSIIGTDTIFSGNQNAVLLTKDLSYNELYALLGYNSYRGIQYTVYYWTAHDGVDGYTHNDTVSYSFSIKSSWLNTNTSASAYENLYLSKARLDPSDGRVAATKTVFPTGGLYQGIEYGSVYYFPYGGTDNLTIDSLDFRYKLSDGFSGASTQNIFANIYEYRDGLYGGLADGKIASNELTQVGLALESLTGLGTPQHSRGFHLVTFSNFVDAATGAPIGTLSDQTFYYISVLVHPSLTGGQATFGENDVPLHGADELNYALNSSKTTTTMPIALSTVKLVDTAGVVSWLGGFDGYREVPSIGLFYSYPRYLGTRSLGRPLKGTLTVAPNPAQDVLQLTVVLKEETDVEYVITDIIGRVVYYDKSQGIKKESSTITIGSLEAGVYLATVKTANGTLTKRFVKL